MTEEEANKRLKAIHGRLQAIHDRMQWIAEEKARSAWIKGFGASGMHEAERDRLLEETDRLIEEMERVLDALAAPRLKR